MPKRFLNVEYAGNKTEVDFTTAERLGEVKVAIKDAFSINVGFGLIQVYNQQGQHINNWALVKSLPDDYFVEDGLCLVVRTIPPPSGESSANVVGSGDERRDRKFLNASGPVDPKKHFSIALETLPWGKQLIQSVDLNYSILLHGHWQSGKTSALQYIQSRAEGMGIKVYYVDMLTCKNDLKTCYSTGQSFYRFLASCISGLSLEHVPKFHGGLHFCDWVQETHKKTGPPILLLDEYDSFLSVCRLDKDLCFLTEMNTLISASHVNGKPFSSIVCAGTFSVVASQKEDVRDVRDDSVEDMALDMDTELETTEPESLRELSQTPWNKGVVIETEPFDFTLFKPFVDNTSLLHNVWLEEFVVNDILATTGGHPGFSIFLLVKAMKQAVGRSCLQAVDWMKSKRNHHDIQLFNSGEMSKMGKRLQSYKQVKKVLETLIRKFAAEWRDKRITSFLRAVGVAKPVVVGMGPERITFTSPIIRDCLLRTFYPPYDSITEVEFNPVSNQYMQIIIFKALQYIKAPQILDPMMMFCHGLNGAAIHAELYRILNSFFRGQPVKIIPETRLVNSTDIRCDIWIQTDVSEFGIELKTECNNATIQEKADSQVIKYASTQEPREMVLCNFVMKEAASVTFPINIQPTGWDKYPKTRFYVLFFKVEGTLKSGLNFSYALHGDTCWTKLNL